MHSALLKLSVSSILLLTTEVFANNTPHITEEITVTATRQADTKHNIAISIADDISFKQPSHIAQSLNSTPGVWISQGASGQENLSAIRSPSFTGGGSCNNFLFSEDNIPLRANSFCNVNQLFDSFYERSQQIEILRGPGTAFQGSGAVHGVINIISPAFTEAASTSVGLLYDSLDKGNLSIDHRSQKWVAQASATKDNGYKDSSDYTQQKIRIKALHEGSNWALTHHFNVMNLNQNTAAYVANYTQQALAADPTLSRQDAYKDKNRKRENSNTDAFRKAQSLRYNLAYNLQTDAGGELLLTPYLRSNQMEFTLHFLPGSPIEKNGHNSLGLQSSYTNTHSNGWNVSTGFDIDYSRGFLKQSQSNTVNFFPGSDKKFPTGKHYDYRVNVASTALFAQFDKDFGNWNLLSGIRFEHARFDYHNQLSDGNACSSTASSCRYTRPSDNVRKFYDWSPHATLSWQFADNHYSYLRLSRGFRTPHTSDLYRLEEGQTTANIDSEKLDAIELGFNGRFDDYFSYQISSYYMKKDNVIIKTQSRLRVDNQKTRHQGIEAAISYSPNFYWLFSLSSSYGKHRYDSNIKLFAAGNSDGNIKGNIIDSAPRHLHNLSIKWFINDGNELALDTQYLGSYFLDAENEFRYPGHTLHNLHFRTQFADGWKLNASIINMTNKDFAYRADISTLPDNGEFVERYFIGEPRSLRISLTKKF